MSASATGGGGAPGPAPPPPSPPPTRKGRTAAPPGGARLGGRHGDGQEGRRDETDEDLPAHLGLLLKQTLMCFNTLEDIKTFFRGETMRLLRDLRESTTLLILLAVTSERHTTLQTLADGLGMTVQGASDYVRRMTADGLLPA